MKNETIIKSVTYLAFAAIIVASSSCGNENKSGQTHTSDKPELKRYKLCKRVSLTNGCLRPSMPSKREYRPLTAYDFYDHRCYEEYKACTH